MCFLRLFLRILKEVVIIFLSLFFYPIAFLLIFLCLPIYIFRFIVAIAGPYLRSDLSKILTTRSSLFAVDDMYKRPRSPILVFMILDGVVEIEGARSCLLEKLVEAKTLEGERVRPELQQFISRWMGFYFWKKDEHFHITNHVKVYDGPLRAKQYNELLLNRIQSELAEKPFIKYRSPWEFLIFPNTVDENGENVATTVCLKIHHAIADGFSILKLVGELITSEGPILPMMPKYRAKLGFHRVLEVIAMLCLVPYQALNALFQYDFNAWHVSENHLTRKINGAVLQKISVDYIKEIKNLADVTFTSVLLAAFSGGIRNFMMEQKVKVPKNIHCITPLPMPGHPDKMRNYMTVCWVTLPIGIADPIERLHAVEEHLLGLRKITIPIMLFYIIPFLGGLFPCLTQLLAKQLFVTAIMSNFPGPPDPVYYCGIPVIDMIFTGGLLPGNIGLGLASISYNGNIRIAAGLDEAIVPPSVPARTLVEKILMELDVLKREFTT